MERVVQWGASVTLLCLFASCASTPGRPAKVDSPSRRHAAPDSSAELSESIVTFSAAAAKALENGDAANSYSHQRLLGPRKRLGEPRVRLEPSESRPVYSSTDCSGWLSFALNTVSPLHEAVLQSQRRLPEHNRAYSEDFSLREGRRPWPRAFVVTQYLRTDHAETTGFEPVADFERLQAGDIGAYAMGRYAKPSDESRPKPKDTGHVFVVTGPPVVVDPKTEDYDGRGSLSDKAAKVIAVPVIDSSATVHFDPDSRKDEEGRYVLPNDDRNPREKPGGVGTGTIWFSLSSEGGVLQRRLGPRQKYRPVLARAARMRGTISLDEMILDGSGALLVKVFDNSPSEFAGIPYGDAPVHLTGAGGLRLASGRLVLNGQNDFTGGVTVESGELIVGSSSALGGGDVSIRGGTVTLHEPAIANNASLSVAEDLPEGALRLDFKGRTVVKSLRIGGTTHLCGTWGGPDSRAMFVHPVFAGSGMLELATEPLADCTPDATDEEAAPRKNPRSRKPRRRASESRRDGDTAEPAADTWRWGHASRL